MYIKKNFKMCGISGLYNYRKRDLDAKKIIKKIINLQDKRGPDFNGIWHSDCQKVYFGHNRLSIIDLSNNANQPFVSNDKNYIITFNGEIYNYKQIRAELKKKDVKFKTSSDTEVLLESYKFWGIKFLDRLRGMFAFAIWDNIKKTIILARDPFGIKPLYFTKKNDVLYFASEIKSILSIENLTFKKSEKSIVSYFLWGNVQEPNTLYKDIESVKGGTVKIINENGSEYEYQFASIKDAILNSKSVNYKNEKSLNDKLKFLIEDTVKFHQVSDVPINILLSAGIDSSVILSSLSDADKKNCSALTLDFELNKKKNESTLARKTANLNKINHSSKLIDDDDIKNLIEDFYLKMDSPTNDGLNNFLISYLAKKNGSKVIISGIGGDEFFSGYPSFERIPKINTLLKSFPKKDFIGDIIFKLLRPTLKLFNINPKYAGILKYGRSIDESFFLQRSLMFPNEIKEFISPEIFKEGYNQLDIFNELNKDVKDFEDANLAIMYLEIKYYLSSKLLKDADWVSMSHSLELRTPFVDWHFFTQLLPSLKSNMKISKENLLNCYKEKLPNELFHRKKTGFEIPHQHFHQLITKKKSKASNSLRNWSVLSYSKYLQHEK